MACSEKEEVEGQVYTCQQTLEGHKVHKVEMSSPEPGGVAWVSWFTEKDWEVACRLFQPVTTRIIVCRKMKD